MRVEERDGGGKKVLCCVELIMRYGRLSLSSAGPVTC